MQITKKVDFLVVNCPSSYNVILGWPTLLTQSCNLNLLSQSKIPNTLRDWGDMWRLAIISRMLLGSDSFQRKSHLDGKGRTCETNQWPGGSRIGGRGPFKSHQGRRVTQPVNERRDSRISKEEPRHLYLDPRGYAVYRWQGDRTPFECRHDKKARLVKTSGLRSREEQSCHGKGRKAFNCRFHLRSLLSWVAHQCCHGQEVQRPVANVCGFHEP